MRRRTEVVGARGYVGTTDQLREMRAQLAGLYPDRSVTMADAVKLAVDSAALALASGGDLPGLPPPTGARRDSNP